MNTFLKKSAPVLALLGLGLAGCQPELDAPKASAGSADFSRYISVGNSLTAGYADGGLYREGQLKSYPSILAQQFALVGGGNFVQPLFTEAQANGSGYLRLIGFTPETPTAASSPITATEATGNVPTGQFASGRAYVAAGSPLLTRYADIATNQNLGVPGIRISDVTTANFGRLTAQSNSSNFNPYYERLLSGTDGNTYRAYVQERVSTIKPTFFSFWLGNNDVLGYATAGGGANAITPTATFTTNANDLLDDLTLNGAKGIVGLIPNVTTIPFFTTVGPSFRANLVRNNVPSAAPFVYTTGLLAPGQANTRVTTTVASIRDAAGTGNLLLTLTASPYLSLYGRPSGKYWRDFYQQARPSLPPLIPNLTVFLAAMQIDTTQNFGTTTGNPFPSILVLDATEQSTVSTATTTFNGILRAKADAKGLAVFDAENFFGGIANSRLGINATSNTAGFLSGNLFSLDGVHPTPRGYAVVANEMLRVINAKYGSTIPFVNPNEYRGVPFP